MTRIQSLLVALAAVLVLASLVALAPAASRPAIWILSVLVAVNLGAERALRRRPIPNAGRGDSV